MNRPVLLLVVMGFLQLVAFACSNPPEDRPAPVHGAGLAFAPPGAKGARAASLESTARDLAEPDTEQQPDEDSPDPNGLPAPEFEPNADSGVAL